MPAQLISGIKQVCLVTENFEKTVGDLADNFGIGPWKCWDYAPPKILQTQRNGAPADWTMKLGVAWLGDVQLEVIQPTGGPTIYRQHLDFLGSGVHHLLVDTGPGYPAAIRSFAACAFPVSQGARINPPMQIGGLSLPALPGFLSRIALQFAYLDTASALGTVLEISKMPPGISFELGVRLGKPDFIIHPGAGAPLVAGIRSAGILVPDLSMAMRRWEALGVGPWQPLPTDGALRVRTSLPPISLDLIQPAGEGIFDTLLSTHGPGIRFLGIHGAGPAEFSAAGFPTIAENEAGTFIDARSAAHTLFLLAP